MRPTLRPAYPLRSPRLSLRPLGADDIPALVAYRSQPEVCRYVPFEPMGSEAVADRVRGSWSRTHLDAEGQALVLGIEERATLGLVGDVTLIWTSVRDQRAEIGYVLHPASCHHGYATEAAHRLLHLAFDDLGFRRVVARIVAGNDPSVRVATRLGMRKEAHLVEHEWFKGAWVDELVFALLDHEWRASHDHATATPGNCHVLGGGQ